MSDVTFQLLAIGLYFAAMIAIGVYAARKTKSHEDYMLAGRELNRRMWTIGEMLVNSACAFGAAATAAQVWYELSQVLQAEAACGAVPCPASFE